MKMIKPAKLESRLRKVHRRDQGLNLTRQVVDERKLGR